MTTGGHAKFIDTKKIRQEIGEMKAQAVLGLHTFTGCDTISCFKGKGKSKPLKIMMKSPKYQAAFSELGVSWTLTDELFEVLEAFVCELYGWKETNIDTVRFNCFRFDHLSDTTMPPSKDSLKLHAIRANYQAKIHRGSLKQYILSPSPAQHGWKLIGSDVTMKWSTMPVAPDAVQKYVHCNCKKTSCNSNQCSCKKAGINCTDLCSCKECSNQPSMEDVGSGSDSDLSEIESEES